MSEQTRATLHQCFRAGQLPTEVHFRDLVDSMLNMKDEGFRKTPLGGLEVTAGDADGAALATFARDGDPDPTRWQLRFGPGGDRLQFDRGPVSGVVSLDAGLTEETAKPRVGIAIGSRAPTHTLEVGGTLAARGRTGTLPLAGNGRVRADGLPQVLIPQLTGCQAFEVMAGVGGGRSSGRYALLHAIVLNAYHPHRPWWRRLWPGQPGIRVTSAHYGRRCDRLALAWEGKRHGKDADYALTIRSGCDYGEGVMIQVAVTQLWFDDSMDGSLPPPR
jgi:hypothetical protein